MSRRRHTPRWVDALIGAGFGLVVIALLAAAILTYNRAFVPSVDIELTTDSLGSALQEGSDVKWQGVPVGEVSAVRTAAEGAVLTLALDPETAAGLGPSTTARLLPKTLFGERYVSLQAAGDGEGLREGDVIDQDRSAEAAELEEVLDELLPLLQSIQPHKLQSALSELATMLRGRGAEFGDTLEAWGEYLTKLEPQVPQLADDLSKLGTVADTYADAAPSLLNALDTLTTTSATFVEQRGALAETYARVVGAADITTGFVEANEQTIDILSAESRKALEAAAPYASQFPCLLKAFRDYIPEMDRTLGQGTQEPGIHVRLSVQESRGKYVPGRDDPRWTSDGSPRCPYVTGRTGARPAAAVSQSAPRTDGEGASSAVPETIPPPPGADQAARLAAQGLGPANSPGENQLIAELMSAEGGTSVADYPAWSSLLLGPVLRGAQVTLQ